MDLNAWFDHVPRTTVDVGHRRLPVFRSLGIIGYQVALAVTVLVALIGGLPMLTALGVAAVAGLSFFAWGLLRRAVTGRESLVLIEYVWVALASVTLFLWATGGPIVAGLDAMAVALCPFLAFGRMGCATSGCCHGLPARHGLRYGPGSHVRDRFVGRRLFPVQLLEAAGLVVIGVVGLALATGPVGRATVWFLVAYAILRFGCEALRGDDRPTLLRIPVPRAMCVVQGAVGVIAAEAWLVPGPPGRAALAGALALGLALVCGLGLTVVRGANPLVHPAAIDEAWELIGQLSLEADPTTPLVGQTSAGMTVGVTAGAEGVHASLSHPDHPTFPVGVALASDDVIDRRGVTHVAWRSPDPSPHVVPPRPTVERVDAAARGSGRADVPGDDYFGRPDGSGDAVVTLGG